MICVQFIVVIRGESGNYNATTDRYDFESIVVIRGESGNYNLGV